MSDQEAETAFVRIRWHATDGKPVCPHCGCETVYDCRKANGAPRWRCKACRKDFSVTSGALFAFHKMPLRNYLAAIAIFVNEVKGKSALALSRDLDCRYKTAFVWRNKLREAMASELKGMQLGGDGETVEVDGGYFGGYIKPANHKDNRRDRRLAKNQNGKRQAVVVMRERGGRTLPAVFRSESAALGFIASRVAHRRALWPTKPRHGMICTRAIRWTGSTIAKPPALAGSTRMGPKNSSPACAVPRSATTTTSRARIWSGTLRKPRGARITGGWTTAGRSRASWGWRWRAGRPWTGRGIGSGRRVRR
jgi:transposase-like protein